MNKIKDEYTMEELKTIKAEDIDFDRISIWTIWTCEDPDLQIKFRSQMDRVINESINWMIEEGIIEEVS